MTHLITRHLRGGGHVTIIRDLDDPRDAKPPAWLRDHHLEMLNDMISEAEAAFFAPRVQTITNPEVGA